MNQLYLVVQVDPLHQLDLLVLGLLYFQQGQLVQAALWHLVVPVVQCHPLDPLALKVLVVQEFQLDLYHHLNLEGLEGLVVLEGLADQVPRMVQVTLDLLSDRQYLADQQFH